MTQPLLTIAIPTYNRNKKLNRTLEILMPQLNDFVKLIIYDNASTISVINTVDPKYLDSLNIVRNQNNIGASANIINCIVNCKTEWLWILGDDDPPHGNAISIILKDIEKDLAFINYKTHMTKNRSSNLYTSGVEELISKLDDFGNFMYISTNILNVKKLSEGLRWAYQFAYSMAPHVAYVLTGMNNSRSLFSSSSLINVALYDTVKDERWNWVPVSNGLITLMEIPLQISTHTKRKYYTLLKSHSLSYKNLKNELLDLKSKDFDINKALYYFDQLALRWMSRKTILELSIYLLQRIYFIYSFKLQSLKKSDKIYSRI